MTALEMQQLFETELQVMSPVFNDSDKPDTDTIFRYINDSQKNIVKMLYNSQDFRSLKKIIKDTTELVPIIDTTIENSTYHIFISATTPDFLFYINSRSRYSRTLPIIFNSSALVYNEEIDSISKNQFITTEFNRPFFRIPKCYIMDNTLRIISDAYTTVTGVIITYVKNPIEIEIGVTDCELDEFLHREIVLDALKNYLQHKTMLSSNNSGKENKQESIQEPER